MFDVLSRFVFSTAIISQLLVIGSLSFNTATAATRCNLRTLIEEGSAVANSRGFQVSKLDGVEKIKLKAATIKELKKIFEKYEWELSATKINEVIEGAANLIKGNSRTPSIEHSNKMAEIGREILKTASGDLNVAQKKLVIYMIAESVLRLESMKITELKDEN